MDIEIGKKEHKKEHILLYSIANIKNNHSAIDWNMNCYYVDIWNDWDINIHYCIPWICIVISQCEWYVNSILVGGFNPSEKY